MKWYQGIPKTIISGLKNPFIKTKKAATSKLLSACSLEVDDKYDWMRNDHTKV